MNNQSVWIPGAIPFFLFGLLYYLISPALAFSSLSRDNELLSVATAYLVDSYFDLGYALDVFFIFLSFYFGYSITKWATSCTFSTLDYASVQPKSPLVFAFAFLTLIIYFFINAAQTGSGFFTGYSDYNVFILGAFSSIVFLSAWSINFFTVNYIRLLFLLFFLFCSALLLGWGSRMFFVLSLISLLLGLISQRRVLLKSIWFYLFSLTLVVIIVFVGVLRAGGSELDQDKFLGVLFAEPLFTALSGFLFLENSGGRPTYNVPHGLFASVIHFIPSFVFPEKMQLIRDLTFDENIVSPFGGTALIVTLYSNFGILYPIYVAAIGSYYGFLFVKSQYSVFYRAVYFSALPILLFLFYREGMETVLKVLFFNGLIVPYLLAKALAIHLAPLTEHHAPQS